MWHRFIKISVVTLIGALAVNHSAVIAQNANRSISGLEVTATIVPDIQIMTIRDINMMDVEAANNILTISPLNNVNAGLMLATGRPNAQIRLNYLKQLEMIRTDGPGQLMITYQVSVYQEDNQRASRLFETIEEALRFSELGKLYIWVGGVIDLNKAYPGNYEGEFTIELEYM